MSGNVDTINPSANEGLLEAAVELPTKKGSTSSNRLLRCALQPEDTAKRCPECERLFGYKLPKHHCRNCGKVVCAACSAHERQVPGYEDWQRVCQPCRRNIDRWTRAPIDVFAWFCCMLCRRSAETINWQHVRVRRAQRKMIEKGSAFRLRTSPDQPLASCEKVFLRLNSTSTALTISRFLLVLRFEQLVYFICLKTTRLELAVLLGRFLSLKCHSWPYLLSR